MINPIFQHSWNSVNNQVRDNKLPSISLRSSREIFGSGIQWHYRTIIGTCQQEMKQKKGFLWWSWNHYYTNYWYYMHDNGSDGKNFWEKSDQIFQFQTAHVRK